LPHPQDSEALAQALRDAIESRRRAQDALEASLRENEALTREIHHRVKNNLQVISSLLSLQSNRIDDPRMRQLFEGSRNRIRSMALVHETLYASANLSKIDMRAYIRALTRQLIRSYAADHVVVTLRIEPVALAIDTAIPCGLVLNELVSNAFRHGFPGRREGEVVIELGRMDEDRCLLAVRDTGIGIPLHEDASHARGLGLCLIDALVSQLQGHVHLDRARGTAYRIDFPPAPSAVHLSRGVA
jgi:two-component sensor histidine kinase